MAIQFIPCKACGKPQRSDRKICMFCHANISTGELPPDGSDEDQEHLLNKNEVRKVLKKPNPWKFALIGCFAVFIGIAIAIKLYPEKYHAVANDAVIALKKINAATKVGVNVQIYNQLTIDAKVKVDDALDVLPQGELKDAIANSMDAYADALDVFGVKLKGEDLFDNEDLGKIIIPKYSIPTSAMFRTTRTAEGKWNIYGERMPWRAATPDEALPIIWSVANSHLERVVSLIE